MIYYLTRPAVVFPQNNNNNNNHSNKFSFEKNEFLNNTWFSVGSRRRKKTYTRFGFYRLYDSFCPKRKTIERLNSNAVTVSKSIVCEVFGFFRRTIGEGPS